MVVLCVLKISKFFVLREFQGLYFKYWNTSLLQNSWGQIIFFKDIFSFLNYGNNLRSTLTKDSNLYRFLVKKWKENYKSQCCLRSFQIRHIFLLKIHYYRLPTSAWRGRFPTLVLLMICYISVGVLYFSSFFKLRIHLDITSECPQNGILFPTVSKHTNAGNCYKKCSKTSMV